nr:flavin reductase [Chloroflexota bacterium]
MRAWATGVTVLATEAHGERHGMTASSFTSVSLEPPLVLVCAENNMRTLRLIQEAGVFAVSVLRAGQVEWSDRFAGRIPDAADRFAGIPVRAAITGAPILENALAYFDCQLETLYPTATHTIVIGRVVAAGRVEGEPLLYWNRGYRTMNNDE